MQKAIDTVFKHYVTFRGRSDRDLFEKFFLFQTILFCIALTPMAIFSATVEEVTGDNIAMIAGLCKLAVFALVLYGIIIFLPSAALVVRRLHDTNRSTWLFWIWCIAEIILVGGSQIIQIGLESMHRDGDATKLSESISLLLEIPMYIIVYRTAQPGTVGENRFGPSPLNELEPDGAIDGLQAQTSGLFHGIGRSIKQNWRNFGVQGRLSRSEYWCFQAILMPALVISLFASILFFYILIAAKESGTGSYIAFAFSASVLVIVFWLDVSTSIRRFHDANYRGWWWFIVFLHPIGPIAWMYLAFKPSTIGDNRFGPQPQPML